MKVECGECEVLRLESERLAHASVWARKGYTNVVECVACVSDFINNPDSIRGMEPENPIAEHRSLLGFYKRVDWFWEQISVLRKALERLIERHEKDSGHKVS